MTDSKTEALRDFYETEILSGRKLAAVLMGPYDYADMRKCLGDDLTITPSETWRTGHMATYQGVAILVDKAIQQSHYHLTHVSGLYQPVEAVSPIARLREPT